MRIALVAEGVLNNITETHLGTGFKDRRGIDNTYPYPMGQHLRGYFGYLLLDMGSDLSASWTKEKSCLLFFKDCLVIHHCDGLLYPIIVEGRFQNYQCSKCGEKHRFATKVEPVISSKIDRYTGKARIYRVHCITGRHKFRFKVILSLKEGQEFKEDFIAMIKFAKEEGVWLGRRKYKGRGRFELSKVNFYYITLSDIKRRAKELAKKDSITIHFVSDVVSDELSCEVLLRSVKTSAKFFHPKYECYKDPFCKVLWKEKLPPKTLYFLDYKGKPRLDKVTAIPAGAKMKVQFKDTCDLFYEGLAIAEMLRGVGKRTSFGKGEFRIVG